MPQEVQLFGPGGDAPLSLTQLLMNLGIGLVLAMIVRWHFLRFGSTLSNRQELGAILPFILLTIILIITVVKSSLALSLGLVGALSIVRFRTPIKEPEELAYLFIAIAIGLGLGANQVSATVLASVFILATMTMVRHYAANDKGKNLYLSVGIDGDGDEDRLNHVNTIIASHVKSSDLRRFDDRSDGFDATYLLDISTTSDVAALGVELRKVFPGVRITFLDQNGMPGI